jgi:hypothetical protein
MKKSLTFLLSLTLLFLFSKNCFAIDLGKSGEKKYKGTNIGVHACTIKNIEMVNKAFPGVEEKYGVGEKGVIRNKCREKHEKLAKEWDWIGGDAKFNKMHERFSTTIKNESSDKIITSISIQIEYKGKDSKSEQLMKRGLWILPNDEKEIEFGKDDTLSKSFLNRIKMNKSLWGWKISEVKYVDFVLR